jgi:heterogeneous nuclear ribonucleoprotein A1/A3
MSFASKVGSLLRQGISGRLGFNETRSVPSIYHALRYMSSSRLFIGGLSYGMDDQSLRESFTEYGEVIEARIIHDRETGRSRGFGFISFTSNEEAAAAITGMDGKDLHGRLVHVNYATERTGGFRSGGGGYGGGGYNQNDGYGTGGGGGYSQNDGNASGGSYSQSAGYDGTSAGTSTGGTKDDFGYDDNVGNAGKGY